MSERRAKGCLVAALVWCVILAALGVGYRFLVHPFLLDKLKGATGSTSQYQDEIVIAADSFSGYAVLRSDPFRDDLKSRQLKVTIHDDEADYAQRIRALRDGRIQLAAFTIDSLIVASAELGEFPGTIVLVLDESRGSDAIVARQQAVSTLQDLDHPEARLVLTPSSPSEFLARVVIAHFNLPRLPTDWMLEADGSRAVFQALNTAGPGEKRAFVLWEPFVTKALEHADVKVLIDSAKLKGFIVDVLVARRQFLRDHPDQVRAVIEAYCRTLYALNQNPAGFLELVREDARKTGAEALDQTQARKVIDTILWKNTLENYAHFGLLEGPAQGGLQHLEDIISNIIEVLLKTKALATDPLDGQPHTLFYRQTLADMKAATFHPAGGLRLIEGLGADAGAERVRPEAEAPALTPEQWTRLTPVGELKLDPILFVRGSARVSLQSERELEALAKRLQSFPRYYLKVVGHTRAEGDPEANRILAQNRAEAAARYLEKQGVTPNRIRTEAAPAVSTQGESQSVSFFVGQVPY